MIYYKVLTKDLKSPWLSDSKKLLKHAVQYKINEWVEPVKNALMVFNSYPSANVWRHNCLSYTLSPWSYKIYTCEIEETYDFVFVCTAPDYILDYMENDVYESSNLYPLGSVFASRVKLLELVE